MATVNKLPNISPASVSNDFSALMQIFESYLNLYVMTCIPVVVDKYEKGKVNVKPVLRKFNSTGDKIDITDDDIIYNIPLMKIKSNGWNLNFEAKKGDFGLLIASKYDITNYKKDHKEADIASRRMFSVSDGFYLPFDFDDKDGAGFVISKENTTVDIGKDTITIKGQTVNVEADTVNLGGEGKGVARIGDSVDLETGIIKTGSEKVKAG